MSKNTSSSAFRKIDVDQFREDNFRDDEPLQSPESGSHDINEAEINGLLIQNKLFEALSACLSNPNIGTKNQAEKDCATALLIRVILAVKQNQVEGIVAKLDNDQRDLLMKYIYRGFEIPSEGSSGQLLFWHEKVFELTGVGSIVRVLTDRNKV